MGGSSSVSKPAKRTNVGQNNADKWREGTSNRQLALEDKSKSSKAAFKDVNAARKNQPNPGFIHDPSNATKSGTCVPDNAPDVTVKETKNAYNSESDEESANLKVINADARKHSKGAGGDTEQVITYDSDLKVSEMADESTINETNDTAILNDAVIDIDRCSDKDLDSIIKRFLAKAAGKERRETHSEQASKHLMMKMSLLVNLF